jgi:hypothetical protein
MNENYHKLISHAVVELPVEKQAEVYDFTRFLKATAAVKIREKAKKKVSIMDLVGIGESKEGDILRGDERPANKKGVHLR